MAKRGFDSTDMLQFLNYAWPVLGQQGMGAVTSVAVTLATIEATDIVLAQVTAYATQSYVQKATITAGTGFVVYCSANPGSATVSYAVFKTNS